MKKFVLVALVAAWFMQAKAQMVQVNDVPGVVVTSFQSTYPSASDAKWRKVGTYYMVDYDQNSNDMYVTYDPTGKIIETGEMVSASTYPEPLTTYVKTKYKDDKVIKVYKVKDANGKTVWKGKTKSSYLIFDSNGNYVKTEKMEMENN